MTKERWSDKWSAGALLREGGLSVVKSGWRGRVLLALALVLGVAIAVVGTLEDLSLKRELADLQAAGRGVVIVSAASVNEVAISRSSCESLSRMDGVARAGILLTSVRTVVSPGGAAVPVVQVSASLVPELRRTTAIVGSSIQERVPAGRIEVDGKLVDSVVGRIQPFGIPLNDAISVVAPASTSTAPSCFVELESGVDATEASPSLVAALDVSGGDVIGVPARDDPSSPLARYLERSTRWLYLALGVLGGVATALVLISRQSEFATYRIAGTSRSSVLRIVSFETAFYGGALALSAISTAAVLSPWSSQIEVVGLRGLAAGAAWCVFSTTAAAILLRQPVHHQLKDR